MAGNTSVDQLFGGTYQGGDSGGASAPTAMPVDQLFGGMYQEPANPVSDIPRPAQLGSDTRRFSDKLTSDWSPVIDEAAKAHGLDPRLMKGIMLAESSGNPGAVSKSGAAGLFQMMPIAVDEVNRQFGTQYSYEDRFDPIKSADMGAKYFGLQLKKANGDTELALRFYNGGYNRERWGKENAAYAGRVFQNMQGAFDPQADFEHPENQSVDSRYAFDVLDNARRFNAPEQSDFMRNARMALRNTMADYTGGAGYLQNLMGNTAAAERDYESLKAQQQTASDLSKPQDQWSGVQRMSELDDFLAGSMGNAAGSMAAPLAGAAAGAALGSVVPGIGTAIGGMVGGALPLAAQYIGNTWGGAVDQNLRGVPNPSAAQTSQAIDALDAGDLTRIGGYGLARGAVEGVGDVALGGLGGGLAKIGMRMLPKSMGGGAVDLLSKGLSNPIDRIGAGMLTEGLTEAADVPLEALGAGRPLSDIRAEELSDSAIGGMAGGGGMVAGGQAITNPRGLGASVRGQLPGGAQYRPDYERFQANQQAYGPAPSAPQYNRDFYANQGWRNATRTGSPGLNTEGTLYDGQRISAEAERMAVERAAQQQAEAQRIPSVKEIHDQLMAEYQALVEQNKPKKVTEEDYNAQRDAHLEQDPEGMAIPAELQSFDAFKKFQKAAGKGQPKPVAPTLSDAAKQRQEIIRSRETGPWVRGGDNQLDMFGSRSGEGQPFVAPPQVEAADGAPGVDPRQLEMDLRGGYAGRRLLTQSGDIFAGQEPEQAMDGQLDMFGGGGQMPTTPMEEETANDEVDPRQDTLPFPVNDAASGRQYEAAFNRAAREEAKQRARDEEDAARRTRDRNTATFSAQDAVAGQNVAAESAPDLGLKRRQVQQLNKAQAAAEKARQDAEAAEEKSRTDTADAFNQVLREPIQPGDRLKNVNGQWQLYPTRRIGRPPRGFTYEKMYLKDGTLAGHVLRPVQSTTEVNADEKTDAVSETNEGREGSNEQLQQTGGGEERVRQDAAAQEEVVPEDADQIIAEKLAEQERLLAEKSAPTVDDLIAKVDSVKMKPKKKPAAGGKEAPVELLSDEEILRAADDDYTSVDRTDDLGELDFGDTEFFSVKPGKPARGVRRSVADPAIAGYKALGQTLGIQVKVFDNAQQALGPNAKIPKGTKGAYWPKSRIVGVFADAADSVQDITTTLRHEIFGHFGLNTLTRSGKRDLLTRIAQSQNVGALREAFAEVARDQPDLVGDDMKMAEEVFARAAERVDDPLWRRAWDRISSLLAAALRKAKLVTAPMTAPELRIEAREIAAGIRKGSRQQQNFPASDDAQFRAKDFIDELEPKLRTTWGQGADMMKDLIVQFRGIPQLARWMPHLKSLQDIHKGERKMQEAYDELADSTIAIVDRMRELPEGVQKDLSQVMLDSTMEGIHPDVGFDHPRNAHLKGNAVAQVAHAKLQADYNRLSGAATKVYGDTRDLFQSMLDRRKAALVSLTTEFSGSAEGEKMSRALDALSKQMPGPYFPLMRFGDHIAVWKSKEFTAAEADNDRAAVERLQRDPNHYLVSFEKTNAAAKRQVQEWIKQNGLDRTDAAKSGATPRSDFQGGVNQSMTPLLMKMESALDTTLAGSDKAQEAKEAIKQVFLTALPDNSIFKSAIKRRNVRGVKATEMLRAIASHGGSQAFHISRLEHSHSIQKGLVALREEDRAATNEGKQLASVHPALAQAIGGLYTQDPTTVGSQLAGALTTSIYYNRLALNPAFWITSFMSPAMVSIPYMGGRHSMLSGYRAWSKGALDAAKIVSSKHLTRFSFRDQIAESKLPDGEREMLLAVEKAGGIDQTALRELNNVARGDQFDDLKRVLGTAAHRVEVVSRISTALSAYRLELKRTGDQAKATEYAIDVVDNTLINYTHAHTPLILRQGGKLSGPVAKVVFQFARYQVGMLNLIGDNFREAWVSDQVSPEVREEARKRFGTLLTIHALATGAGGAFGYSFLVGAANMVVGLFNPDDEPADVEKKARKVFDDLSVEISGNKGLSVALRRGIPASLGWDISARMGMADVLSPRRENPFKGDKAEMAAGVIGAIPGAAHLLDWVSWAKDPTLKSLPVSMVSNLAKAYELYDKGMLNKHGVVKKGSEDYNAVDLMLQGLGFPPTESTEAYANQASARNLDKAIMGTRQKLLDGWNNAMNSGDQAAVADSRKEIQEFNGRHQGQWDVMITANTLTKSRKQRMERERRMNSEGVYIPKKGGWRQDNFTEEADQ
jgi:hypothetical protein